MCLQNPAHNSCSECLSLNQYEVRKLNTFRTAKLIFFRFCYSVIISLRSISNESRVITSSLMTNEARSTEICAHEAATIPASVASPNTESLNSLALVPSRKQESKKRVFSLSGVKGPGDTSRRPPAEIKHLWRQQQIVAQQQQASLIDSSWRLRHFTSLWGGWMYKRSSGIVRRWQLRWFEVCCETVSGGPELVSQLPASSTDAAAKAACSPCVNRAMLKYTAPGHHGEDAAERLRIIAANRDRQHDRAGRACVSVKLGGKNKPLLLDAVSDSRAEELLSCIAFILATPSAD